MRTHRQCSSPVREETWHTSAGRETEGFNVWRGECSTVTGTPIYLRIHGRGSRSILILQMRPPVKIPKLKDFRISSRLQHLTQCTHRWSDENLYTATLLGSLMQCTILMTQHRVRRESLNRRKQSRPSSKEIDPLGKKTTNEHPTRMGQEHATVTTGKLHRTCWNSTNNLHEIPERDHAVTHLPPVCFIKSEERLDQLYRRL